MKAARLKITSISGNALDDLNLDHLQQQQQDEASKSRKSSGMQQQQSKSRNCSGGSSISQGIVNSAIMQQQQHQSNPVHIPDSASGKLTPPQADQHGHENVRKYMTLQSRELTCSKGNSSFQNSLMGMNQFGLFDLTSSPNKQQQDPKDAEISRLKEEVLGLRNRLGAWDEGLNHARAACDAWQKETALAAKKADLALKEKEAAMAKVAQLQKEMEDLAASQGQYLHAVKRTSELPTLPIGVLKAFEWQLRKDLQEVEKVILCLNYIC